MEQVGHAEPLTRLVTDPLAGAFPKVISEAPRELGHRHATRDHLPQTHIEADPVRCAPMEPQSRSWALATSWPTTTLSAPTSTLVQAGTKYDLTSQFHDPFVLFSFLSAVTTKLDFVTGILILPQRQTALVAKQTACLDVLCGGRFRLGIGTGWNDLEYEALGVAFGARGRMMEEQVAVLRGLLTQEVFTFSGEYHSIPDVGLCPMPVQRPVPLVRWPERSASLRKPARAGECLAADCTVGRRLDPPIRLPGERTSLELLERFRSLCREYGRDPDAIGLEVRMQIRAGSKGDGRARSQDGARSGRRI
jgi:probable F420-dependent oxidoreductase